MKRPSLVFRSKFAVRGLLARGLIRREPDPHDRCAVRLFPTMSAQRGMAL